MSIEYYVDNRSGSCRRTTSVIKELGLDVVYKPIDLLQKENKSDSFLALNPNSMLPVIIDRKAKQQPLILTEAMAINIYLCDTYGGTHLLPKDGTKRYQILQWMSWAAEHFRQPAPIYFEENVITQLMGTDPNTTRLQQAEFMLSKHGQVLDSHLANKCYVVGEKFSLADIDLASALSQMPYSKLPVDRFKHIMRWAKDLEKNHESWKYTGDLLHTGMRQALNHTQ
ncbi:glutathione S-transferase family protein [Agaribacterium sp. ZY112]|uniref:glutathione S-transferase family protein n=1 Tax=Agaribacterium sp. ZY112 TaxID=3233574 RepID=UPI003526389D